MLESEHYSGQPGREARPPLRAGRDGPAARAFAAPAPDSPGMAAARRDLNHGALAARAAPDPSWRPAARYDPAGSSGAAMRNEDCVRFLKWCLPRLRLRWPGYRKVRKTVCKRITRRLRDLGLDDLDGYRALLAEDPEEWARLDAFCRIPVSRFCRDRQVFEAVGRRILVELAERAAARGAREVRCWSAGCASGEEAYSLRLVWDLSGEPAGRGVRLAILGTDADEAMLTRAAAACYERASLKDLPAPWLEQAFTRRGTRLCLRPEFRRGISFRQEDIRTARPAGRFDLILCRNLVFTYFEASLQEELLGEIDRKLRPGGFLVIGAHERLPKGAITSVRAEGTLPVYRKAGAGK
ncbi:MAG: CheR family methyltransferase [Kiloniellaceae bacterium]